jgi:hypothetical protein
MINSNTEVHIVGNTYKKTSNDRGGYENNHQPVCLSHPLSARAKLTNRILQILLIPSINSFAHTSRVTSGVLTMTAVSTG